MDSLTHVVLGAIIGEVVAGKKLGKKALLIGAIAANLPDLDSILNFIVSDAESMLVHRGFSHSLFLAVLAGPLIGWMLYRLFDKNKSGPLIYILLVTINLIIHDLIDTCTMYGTGLLIPFSDHRFSFDNIFVADPLYTLPLIIAVAAVLIKWKDKSAGKKYALYGIVVSSVYLLSTFFSHNSALKALSGSLDKSHIHSDEKIAVPTLFNSVLWYLVAKTDSGYKAGYYSIFDKQLPELYLIEKHDELEQNVTDKYSVDKLKKFSKNYYSFSTLNDKIYFNDLRFGQINGWENPESGFAFSFDLTPGANNKMVVQQGRVESTKREILDSMFQRMKGN